MFKKSQSTLEYAVIISCVIAALVSMTIYVKRAFSGKLREVADSVGEQYSPRGTTGESHFAQETETESFTYTTPGFLVGVNQDGEPAVGMVDPTEAKIMTFEYNVTNKDTTSSWGHENVDLGESTVPPSP